jgi:hypothetical protein
LKDVLTRREKERALLLLRVRLQALGAAGDMSAVEERTKIKAVLWELVKGLRRADVAKELQIPVEELNKIIFGLVLSGLRGGGVKVTSPTKPAAIKLRLVN